MMGNTFTIIVDGHEIEMIVAVTKAFSVKIHRRKKDLPMKTFNKVMSILPAFYLAYRRVDIEPGRLIEKLLGEKSDGQ